MARSHPNGRQLPAAASYPSPSEVKKLRKIEGSRRVVAPSADRAAKAVALWIFSVSGHRSEPSGGTFRVAGVRLRREGRVPEGCGLLRTAWARAKQTFGWSTSSSI